MSDTAILGTVQPAQPIHQPPNVTDAHDHMSRMSPSADPAEAVERVISRRQLLVEPGDVVLSREAAGSLKRLSQPFAWQYRLHLHPKGIDDKIAAVYVRYELAAAVGEELASTRRVRLFYEEDSMLTLLKDYRPA